MMTETGPAHVAAALALAEAGIPMDVQELLLRGDPMRGIKPSVLFSAIDAYLKAMGSEPVAWRWKSELFDWNLTEMAPVDQHTMEAQTGVNMRGLVFEPLFSAPPAPARDEEIERLTAERDLLRTAVARYGDRKRMSFAQSELQQIIDDALSATGTAIHPDQTSPMTVGPEAFFEDIEQIVETYRGGEYEAQGCAVDQILADIHDFRALQSERAGSGDAVTAPSAALEG